MRNKAYIFILLVLLCNITLSGCNGGGDTQEGAQEGPAIQGTQHGTQQQRAQNIEREWFAVPFPGLPEQREGEVRIPDPNQNLDEELDPNQPDPDPNGNIGQDPEPDTELGQEEQRPEELQPREGEEERDAQQEPEAENIREEVIRLTNQEREQNGLNSLEQHGQLMDAAQAKSEDMAEQNYFSHTSPTYGTPFEMIEDFGINYQSASENIAAGQQSAEQVVRNWMESEGHRRNILDANVTHIGIGFEDDGNYWTQLFIQQ
ncbi:CAP domain-containing protein [Bacillus sp. FJAT-44742]|uniref:CAP domain-containing protein n=1 Tax=Bacillus sp. FJAT-44742 TaxID=2014005 RepID=UPI000C24FA93|nr:CAP domain-containing protein [Bacillus sp. FJAT-44742]